MTNCSKDEVEAAEERRPYIGTIAIINVISLFIIFKWTQKENVSCVETGLKPPILEAFMSRT